MVAASTPARLLFVPRPAGGPGLFLWPVEPGAGSRAGIVGDLASAGIPATVPVVTAARRVVALAGREAVIRLAGSRR
jgi:hypothetical protein